MNKLNCTYFMRIYLVTFALILTITNAKAVEVGNKAPSCDLSLIDEPFNPLDIQQLAGQVVYLDFWASWCAPCAKSFPFMNQLEADLSSKGLKVIAVNLDEELNDADDFLKKIPAKFSVVVDKDQQCARKFDVKAMPSSYVIDRKGVVRHVHLGFRPGEIEQLKSAILQLVDEKI